MMAADLTAHGVPPSLSARVTGYVDNRFNHIVTVFDNVKNYKAALKRLHNTISAVLSGVSSLLTFIL